MHPDTAAIERALELFEPLRDAPADCLERLRSESNLVRIPAGTHLFDEHASCSAFPIVLDGVVRISKLGPEGREITLYRVSPGESCVLTSGCLLSGVPYNAAGIAETDVTLLALPQSLFDMLLLKHEPFRHHVFGLFAERLADLTLLIEEVAFRRVDQRLAALLLARGPHLRTTHQALADELGSVREIVTRVLGQFASAGWVQLGREQISLTDKDALSRFVHDPRYVGTAQRLPV
jgi:CRP/FNR family transcriptional regulator